MSSNSEKAVAGLSGFNTDEFNQLLLSTLMSGFSDCIYFKDCESRFIAISQSLAKSFGLNSPDDAIGKKDSDFFSSEHAQSALYYEEKIMTSGQPIIDFLEKETWSDGSVSWVSTTKMPFKNSAGDIIGTYGISRDVTKRKVAEDERADLQVKLQHAQKMEAVGQLAAGVAHEINTPIQYISDNVRFLTKTLSQVLPVLSVLQDLLEEGQASEGTEVNLKSIQALISQKQLNCFIKEAPLALSQSQEGLGKISMIVSAMKFFSHPSDGKKQKVNIPELLESMAAVARNEWKYLADLEFSIAANLPDVSCIRDELGQVVLNLLVNAAHAIEETLEPGIRERGKINISAKRSNDFVEIGVTDDGCGISDNIKHKIFDSFFTTKPVGKGTGQGLNLSYMIVVDKHGGSLTFTSSEKKGTHFVIRLPIEGT